MLGGPHHGRSTGRGNAPAIPDGRVGLCIGSPYTTLGLGAVHARAFAVMRDAMGLTEGSVGRDIDRMLCSGASEADQLFLLRALLLSRGNGAQWAAQWPRIRALYEIEFGTQVLLGPLDTPAPVRELLRRVRHALLPVALDAPWGEDLCAVVMSVALPRYAEARPRVRGPAVWLGADRHKAARPAECATAVSYGDTPDAARIATLLDTLQLGARQWKPRGTGNVVAFPRPV